MEYNQLEVVLVQEKVAEMTELQQQELNQLQLVFNGGGLGEVSPY